MRQARLNDKMIIDLGAPAFATTAWGVVVAVAVVVVTALLLFFEMNPTKTRKSLEKGFVLAKKEVPLFLPPG